MEFKGTKGKWVVELNDHDPFYRRNVLEVGLKGCYPVAVLYGDGNDFNDEVKANAQLIAHAPEMLEMLSKVNDRLNRRTLPTESEVNQFVKDIQDLITRATTI